MQFDSCLPGILTAYDGKKGNVRPLISVRMVDGSYLPFSEVHDVPVISPASAFAGLKLPIKVGDKVVLHIADRDIQSLLFDKRTAGLDDPENALPPTNRQHNLTDAIAYTGFQSLDDMIPSDNDIWIFNNTDSDSYNHVRIKGDGSIELKTLNASATLEKNGDIRLENNTCSTEMTNLGSITTQNLIAKMNMDPLGNVTTTNGTTTIRQDTKLGTVTVVAPLTSIVGNLAVTGSIASGTTISAVQNVTASGVGLISHKHNPGGDPPLNPS